MPLTNRRPCATDTLRHFCPHAGCAYRGGQGLGNLRTNGQPVAYGYLLWPLPHGRGTIHEGAFAARGIFGQHLYMHPKEKVVVVVLSALPKPTGKAPVRDDDFFAAVV